MASSTIFHNPFSCPVSHALSMGSSNPVLLLPEMTLTTHIINMIKVNLALLFCHKKIPIIFTVACIAGKRFPLISMGHFNIRMRDISSIKDRNFFIIVTRTASETFDLIFSCLCKKISPLILLVYFNNIFKLGYAGFNLFIIVKFLCCFLIFGHHPLLV